MISKNDEAKMILYNALPKKEYERIFMCDTTKDIWNSLIITHHGNKQVKDNKIDLFVQKYEEFIISDDENIDCAFARFNTIITSLKGLDESFSSQSKDLSTLPLDELIGNLKVYEVVIEKDLEISKNKEEKYKSLAPKARKVLSEEEATTSDSNDEEYAMAAFVVGCWSDSEDDSKKEEICFMARDDNEVLSDTPYYSSSSLDNESWQNEYDKLYKISLRIINKNKQLRAKNEVLKREAYELKTKIEQLERDKEISLECESKTSFNGCDRIWEFMVPIPHYSIQIRSINCIKDDCAFTTRRKDLKKNDVKQESLLMALPNEHQLTLKPSMLMLNLCLLLLKHVFGGKCSYKDRHKKASLKQQYENLQSTSLRIFGTLSLTVLQKPVSRLAILGVRNFLQKI
ncbi:hypothetical protein Tco_0199879 [Tanacetum coccineum]